MYKVINEQEAVINSITKRTHILVPNGPEGKIRTYTVIDAVTCKDKRTYVLLEHLALGEEDCIITLLPSNSKLLMVRHPNEITWKDSGEASAYLIPNPLVLCASYNGLDDLEDCGIDLEDGLYWSDEEINNK